MSCGKLHQDNDMNAIEQNNHLAILINNSLDSASNIISPIGIYLILTLIKSGATGKSNNELDEKIGDKLDILDVHFFMKQFNNEYISIINQIIVADINYLDKKFISLTEDIIKIRVDPNLSNNSVYIMNNILMTGEWLYGFDSKLSSFEKFHHTINIYMMKQVNYFDYYSDKRVQVMEMEYRYYGYKFGIILPKNYMEELDMEYNIADIPIIKLSELNEMINNMSPTLLNISIPKFTHFRKYNMKNILQKNGITTIFSKNADLDMIGNKLHIKNITHIVTVRINENGGKSKKIKFTKIKKFDANHPFIYYIRHVPSNMILLYGDFQG